MILLWLVLAVVLAVCIARYNSSNKLFWILFTSFVGGIAVCSIAYKLAYTEEKKDLVQAYPTQEFTASGDTISLLAPDVMSTPEPIMAEPVSQDTTPDLNEICSKSERLIAARKLITSKSSTLRCYSNILTRLDDN